MLHQGDGLQRGPFTALLGEIVTVSMGPPIDRRIRYKPQPLAPRPLLRHFPKPMTKPFALLMTCSALSLALWGGVASAEEKKAEPPAPAAKTDKKESAHMSNDAAIAAVEKFIADQKIDTTKSGWKTSLPKPEKVTFTAGKKYFWNLQTNKGAVKVLLLPDSAPMHVSSTIYLTKLGFYDALKFHRVITGFMAQGGDPLGTGTGGPGYKYDGEFGGTAKHDKPGKLSMANAGPGTDGSQFFLTFVPTPWLDGKHSIFGEVVDGLDVLKKLEAAGSQSGQTSEPLAIDKATITVE